MTPRKSRKPKMSRKPRKSRTPRKLGGASLCLFGYMMNESVDSSLRDICRRGMQPAKHPANIWNHHIDWRAVGWQFEQTCTTQQLTDAASALFGSDKTVVQASVQRLVVDSQFACPDLQRSPPNCADLVVESLRDWTYGRPVMRHILNSEPTIESIVY